MWQYNYSDDIYEKLGFKAEKLISDEDDVWGGLTSMKLKLD